LISPHELRAPSEDGGILCHPAPPLLAELISENRKRLSNATPLILGRSLQDIRKGLDEKITGDLLALDIRTCLHFLGEITGEVTNEDRLDFIFSKFCIGK